MVCLSSRGPNSERLLRYASRLAGKLNRNWYAVYVQTPSEEATAIDARTQRLLSDTLTLAKQLGAMVFTYKGEDVVDTLLRFAGEYRVGHIVVGRSCPKPFWKRLKRNRIHRRRSPEKGPGRRRDRPRYPGRAACRRRGPAGRAPPGGGSPSAGRRASVEPPAGRPPHRHLE